MTQVTWGPGPATVAPLQEVRKTSTIRLVLGGLVAIVLLGAVTVLMVTNNPSLERQQRQYEVHEDEGQGIGWGSPLNTDWSCAMVTPTAFACAGSSPGAVAVTSGSREATGIRKDLLSGAVASIRYDDRRWRCDGSVTSFSGTVAATSCTRL